MFEADSEIVHALVVATGAFDEDTMEHTMATGALARRVAMWMGLDSATVKECHVGALLHDVGMIGIDHFILGLPEALCEAQWELLTTHPICGERLLLAVPSLVHIAPLVRSHHERIDGTGYPDGLRGDEIPLAARVIAVVDAFHTMTMPLAYRNAFSTTTAMAELIGNGGSQFDQHVVTAFAAMMGHSQRRLRLA